VPKSLTFGNCILCEFVAKGDRNKHTLVNVFSGDVVVEELPARLRFWMYVEWIPQTSEPTEILLEIQLGRNVLSKIQVKSEGQKTGVPGVISIPGMEFEIDRDLNFSIFASCEGYKRTKVLSKRIYKGATAPV
jgi:hypothetical protein